MSRDPEERCGPGTGGPEPAGDAFDQIVAGWLREGAVPQWPADVDGTVPEFEVHELDGTRESSTLDGPSPGDRTLDGRTPDGRPPDPGPPARPPSPTAAAEEPDEDDHFVPPDPPPLPRLGPPAAVGLTLLGLGLLLIIIPGWFGMSAVYGLPLGLLSLAAGLGWLVLRLWPSPPQQGTGDGEDDGAVL